MHVLILRENISKRGKTWYKDLHYDLEESVRIFHSPENA